ncbi:EAL domain-containing protein [Erythrobacter sp. SCSIO 43205]|uniref:putative bifunctional diguanylate cyclase/phosphodiesterase n=1 Tax=Erythrobacter sp. SCSIO 43205 TaxID=2779361 RepID=UPI001CA8A5F9|nr:EAL domain-containing protein [Erythrobacter sp. SCSIO 43205]UAB76793.1 EAL domain-containing protein [Erythrobacter sp. SCSIO 43205]
MKLPPTARKWAIVLVSLIVCVALARTDGVRLLEQEQRAAIAQLAPKQASGDLHIVEVDAKSLAQNKQWPWPRDHHARLVEQLDAAGARSIIFDIDFSARSTPDGDADFARALSEVTTASVALPTFGQRSSENSYQNIDTLPLPELREHVSLATVSVIPDADSRVRRMVYGTITNGTPRPSLSAQIAGISGSAGQEFVIDYSIDPASIPRHSFIDIERGQFDAETVRGRDVIVGATAIELGDRYGAPIYGVIPGVTIQALAAETLMRGAMAEVAWWPLLIFGIFAALYIVRSRTYFQVAVRSLGAIAVLIVLDAIAYHLGRTLLSVVPTAILILASAALQTLWLIREKRLAEALVDPETGLPNALAFKQEAHDDAQFTMAAYIKGFDSIRSVLGQDQVGAFVERVIDSAASVHPIKQAYRADTRIVAWTHSGDYQELIEACEKIGVALEKPINVAGKRVDTHVAFGLAAGADLNAASRAASFAADSGKLWHAHEDAEAAIIEQRVSLMGELEEAIDERQVRLVYQPKLNLKTNRIESVEALMRWEHPVHGFMRPDLFIPLAEETGRIDRLTLFAIESAITQLRQWCEQDLVISVAVNISANLITSERFVAAAEYLLGEMRVPHERLIFEITESAAMSDPDLAAANLERFCKLGVLISIDDYGTGQSTLSYLQKLPLKELKIDRAFVQHAHENRSDGLMVRSTIELAHSLNLRVVCEGIEDQECLDFLRENGCDYAQGYFIAKPLPPHELTPLLAEQPGKEAQENV